MPEESINIFINNIYSIAIFAAMFLFIFIFIFLLSRFLIYKSKKKMHRAPDSGSLKYSKEESDKVKLKEEVKKLESCGFNLSYLRKDFNILKDIFLIGLIFVLTIFLILLIILSLYFVVNIQEGRSLFVILTVIFFILTVTVYAIRSKVINR